MTSAFWMQLSDAVAAVRRGLTRVDGDGFKVYRVAGGIVRIDLPPQKGASDGEAQDRADVQA